MTSDEIPMTSDDLGNVPGNQSDDLGAFPTTHTSGSIPMTSFSRQAKSLEINPMTFSGSPMTSPMTSHPLRVIVGPVWGRPTSPGGRA